MNPMLPYYLTVEKFHAVSAAVCKQTISESTLHHSIDMGAFTVHHGVRDGAPITIAQHHGQKADELSGIWFDDN